MRSEPQAQGAGCGSYQAGDKAPLPCLPKLLRPVRPRNHACSRTVSTFVALLATPVTLTRAAVSRALLLFPHFFFALVVSDRLILHAF